MRLKSLINDARFKSLLPLSDFEVAGISCNSKKVRDNFVFVAIQGNRQDGHLFIKQAIAKGAKAVVVSQDSCVRDNLRTWGKDKINLLKARDTRKALGVLAARFYGEPSKQIKVIGVTGTNGKTTVTYLIESILKEAGYKPAVIGTINYRFADTVLDSKNTTPGAEELQGMLKQMHKQGVEFALMEVSSHALAQERTAGIAFHSALFTNLTQDHLDYHRTMKNYFQAKLKLFSGLTKDAFALLNKDDTYGRKIKKLTSAEVITYGLQGACDIRAEDVAGGIEGTRFILRTSRLRLPMRTGLIGLHNVYNIIASAGWALRAGIDASVIRRAVGKFSFVPGRLERVNSAGGFSVFVDYAHTEDALQHAICALRPLAKKRIVVVFGCGGERDRSKRPKMGRVVSELADLAIITSDNPRSEDPRSIIEDILKGVKKDNYSVMPQRLEAIKKSLSLAGAGDIVLIAGKGHENYQLLKNRSIHFDDREVVRQCLRSMNC